MGRYKYTDYTRFFAVVVTATIRIVYQLNKVDTKNNL